MNLNKTQIMTSEETNNYRRPRSPKRREINTYTWAIRLENKARLSWAA